MGQDSGDGVLDINDMLKCVHREVVILEMNFIERGATHLV